MAIRNFNGKSGDAVASTEWRRGEASAYECTDAPSTAAAANSNRPRRSERATRFCLDHAVLSPSRTLFRCFDTDSRHAHGWHEPEPRGTHRESLSQRGVSLRGGTQHASGSCQAPGGHRVARSKTAACWTKPGASPGSGWRRLERRCALPDFLRFRTSRVHLGICHDDVDLRRHAGVPRIVGRASVPRTSARPIPAWRPRCRRTATQVVRAHPVLRRNRLWRQRLLGWHRTRGSRRA